MRTAWSAHAPSLFAFQSPRETRASVCAMAEPAARQTTRLALELVQEKWVLMIVNALLAGPKGFNAIGRDIGGCNPTTLTQRLQRLETLGVIVKGDAGYTLTEAGRHLDGVISELERWADLHMDPSGVCGDNCCRADGAAAAPAPEQPPASVQEVRASSSCSPRGRRAVSAGARRARVSS